MKFFSFFPTCLWVLLPLACLLLGLTQRADLHDQVAPTQIQITNCFSRAKRQSVIRYLPSVHWEGNFYLTFLLHIKRSGLAKVVLYSFPAVFHIVKRKNLPSNWLLCAAGRMPSSGQWSVPSRATSSWTTKLVRHQVLKQKQNTGALVHC